MATTTPHVFRQHLTYKEAGQECVLFLESFEWWEWLDLEETRLFRFTGFQGHFTARCENKQGKWYWYAYRKDAGTLVKAYLGKSPELTERHLERVAQTIAERCHLLRDPSLAQAHSPELETQHGMVSREDGAPQLSGKRDREIAEHLFAGNAVSVPPSQEGNDEQVAAWHLKAAHWYEQHGFLDDALQHLLAAHHFPEAAQVLERFCEQLMKSGKIAMLLRWLQALPAEDIQSRPYLSLYYAGALVSSERFDEAERHLRNAERAIEAMNSREIATSTNQVTSQMRHMVSALTVTRASLAGFRADVVQTLELSRQARSQFVKADAYLESVLLVSLAMAYLRSGDLFRAAETFRAAGVIGESAHHFHLSLASASAQAYLVMEQGHLHLAAERYRQLLCFTTDEKEQSAALSSAYLGLGELHYYWNELDLAEHSLRRGLNGAVHAELMTIPARATLFLVKIQLARGKITEAFDDLQVFEKQIQHQHLLHFLPYLGAIRAMILLAEDEIEQAVSWAQESHLHVDDDINHLSEFPYVILAQVFMRAGRYEDAALLLARLLTLAEKERRMRSVVDLLVCQAAVLQRQGKHAQAQQVLLRSLLLAEPEGWLRVFLDQGAPIRILLTTLQALHTRDLSSGSPMSVYVNKLLAIIEREQTARFAPHSSPSRTKGMTSSVVLTAREREVLHLVALGLSNQHIARELVIAVSTVKWHLKQISTKLLVHSRIQMIARAREIHLL